MRWAGHVVRVVDSRGLYGVLVGIYEGKRAFGRRWCRWEGNIEMDLQEVGWGMECIELAQGSDRWRALGNILNEPSSCIKCGEFLDWLRNCLILRKVCDAWS